MALMMVAKWGLPMAGACIGERYLTSYICETYSVSAASPALGGVLPRMYGLVVLGVIYSGFVLIGLGSKVGKARSAAIEKAKKDGDKDAEARYSYPKIYAEGFSAEAKLFNCVQRGHQHALETYPSFLALSLLGGLSQPVVSFCATMLWCEARKKWAEGYATGEPGNRYSSSKLGFHVWTSLLLQMFCSVATAITLFTGI